MEQNSKTTKSILVTGATGSVGRHLVHELIRQGQKVRALSRHPEKAAFSDEVEVISGDLNQPETFSEILKDVKAMHLITIGGDDHQPLKRAQRLIRAAEQSGVQRVSVLWSGTEGPVEEAVKASRMEWTILQPQEYMKNTLEWTGSILTEGKVQDVYIHRPTAMIHEGDIAKVAAAALLQEGHAGKSYTLTGPETLTPAKAVHILGETIGRKIDVEELPEDIGRERLRKLGIDDEVIEYILSWYRDTPPEGYTTTDTVERITGHPPRSFRQWAAEHAQAFMSAGLERQKMSAR